MTFSYFIFSMEISEYIQEMKVVFLHKWKNIIFSQVKNNK